jgi:lipoprotein signal peptidase
VVIDQATKFWAESATCGPIVCPLRNDALFLGVGSGSDVDVLAMTAIGLGLFVLWLRSARAHGRPVPSMAAAIVTAGILANATDRIALDAVRDFLAIPGGVVLNIADVGVIGGLALCVASQMRTSSPRSITERG